MWGGGLESCLLLGWVCSGLGPRSGQREGPGSCSASLSMQVWGRGGTARSGCRNLVQLPTVSKHVEENTDMGVGVGGGRDPRKPRTVAGNLYLRVCLPQVILSGVNTRQSNCGKEEMREQSLFEETTEISICKDEKQKQKNPWLSKTLSKTRHSRGWLLTRKKA